MMSKRGRKEEGDGGQVDLACGWVGEREREETDTGK